MKFWASCNQLKEEISALKAIQHSNFTEFETKLKRVETKQEVNQLEWQTGFDKKIESIIKQQELMQKDSKKQIEKVMATQKR